MPTTIPHTGPYDSDFDDPLFDADLEGYAPASDERSAAAVAHLAGYVGLLGPLLVYFLKRDDSAYVEDQAADAVNFQLTLIVAALAGVVTIPVLVGVFVLLGVVVASLVAPAVAAVQASRGEWYRYPLTIRFLK